MSKRTKRAKLGIKESIQSVTEAVSTTLQRTFNSRGISVDNRKKRKSVTDPESQAVQNPLHNLLDMHGSSLNTLNGLQAAEEKFKMYKGISIDEVSEA